MLSSNIGCDTGLRPKKKLTNFPSRVSSHTNRFPRSFLVSFRRCKMDTTGEGQSNANLNRRTEGVRLLQGSGHLDAETKNKYHGTGSCAIMRSWTLPCINGRLRWPNRLIWSAGPLCARREDLRIDRMGRHFLVSKDHFFALAV